MIYKEFLTSTARQESAIHKALTMRCCSALALGCVFPDERVDEVMICLPQMAVTNHFMVVSDDNRIHRGRYNLWITYGLIEADGKGFTGELREIEIRITDEGRWVVQKAREMVKENPRLGIPRSTLAG